MPILEWLKLPEAKQITDIDAPETTLQHAAIIKKKPFLKNLYIEFYTRIANEIGNIEQRTCVELGSGGGFLKEVFPSVKTSDILDLDHLDYCFSGDKMPFDSNSIDAFMMMDVLHHISKPTVLFNEFERCLKPGGKIVMIEPANTWWGRFVYQNFHHEPFDPKAGWELPAQSPLSSANGAMPWIIFCRDRQKFETDYPNLQIRITKSHTPLRYLLSGGVSMKQLVPSFSFGFFTGLEWLLSPLAGLFGMFFTIVIEKKN